jgi:hypothetical protein
MRYFEVAFETAWTSGFRRVLARNGDEALAKFREEWSEYGDVSPSCWLTGACWNLSI